MDTTMNNEEVFEDYLDLQRHWIYYLSKDDKDNLLSFLKGFSKGRKNRNLIDYLRLYLHHIHQIDMRYNRWEDQIEHYAYLKNKEWHNGFYILLSEVLEHQYNLPPLEEITPNTELEQPNGKQVKMIFAPNMTLRVGDFIQLSDKIGEDYKQTKFYDGTLPNASWELFYPSDEKDFKNIYFYLPEQKEIGSYTFGRVWRIFSDSISKVESIWIQNEKIIAYTNNFKIDVKAAMEEKEFKVLSNKNNDIIPTNLTSLTELFFNHAMGFITVEEVFDSVNFLYICIENKNWVRYKRGMSQIWQLKK